MHPISDDPCYKLNEDLCMQCLIGLAVHGSVTKEGFIFPEQLLGCDDDEVPTEGNLLIDDLISFPAIHKSIFSSKLPFTDRTRSQIRDFIPFIMMMNS